MAAPIKLEASVIQRIEVAYNGTEKSLKGFGLLIGRWDSDELSISGCYRCIHSTEDAVQHNLQEVAGHIPVGFSICGVFIVRSTDVDTNTALRDMRMIVSRGTKTVQGHTWPDHIFTMMFANDDGDIKLEEMFWYHADSRDVSDADVEIIATPPVPDDVTFRVHGEVKFTVEYNKNKETVLQRVATQLQLILDSLSPSQTVFLINKSNILIGKDGVISDVVDSGTACSKLIKFIEDEEEDDGFEVKVKKKKDYKKEVIHVTLLHRLSAKEDLGSVPTHTPVINQDEETRKLLTVYLPIDVLCTTPSYEPLGNVSSLFTTGVADQLACMGRCLCQFYDDEFHKPVPHHFKPWSDGHLLTVVYPESLENEDNDHLENYRRMLHEKFLLPMDRPLLRRGNRYRFPDEVQSEGLLFNPHIGLSSPSGGVDSIVHGVYAYHHYMQDRIDDNGWGCAYRSLQTLISWFNHQGYTNVPIPTHQEIQSALVDMKDKEPSFVGTKRWIGSTEVSYCLDYFLDVTSKILFVSSGADLANKGRELAQHFQVQGTPIMIGGGVLAHTILGVNYNSDTGDLKFLILDPHYTGGEDLKVIQSKGWCGWKGTDFWNKTAYYNLCMPQRPIVI